MGSKEKREQRIRANPINVSLEDFEALVKHMASSSTVASIRKWSSEKKCFHIREEIQLTEYTYCRCLP